MFDRQSTVLSNTAISFAVVVVVVVFGSKTGLSFDGKLFHSSK